MYPALFWFCVKPLKLLLKFRQGLEETVEDLPPSSPSDPKLLLEETEDDIFELDEDDNVGNTSDDKEEYIASLPP